MSARKRSSKDDDESADAYSDKDEETVGEGEVRGSPKMGVAVITGSTFANKSVVYYEVEGIAIVEGDIALGTVDRVQRATELAREAATFSAGLVRHRHRRCESLRTGCRGTAGRPDDWADNGHPSSPPRSRVLHAGSNAAAPR